MNVVSSLTTPGTPELGVGVYLFLTRPTAVGAFDPDTGIEHMDFRITVSGISTDCYFKTYDAEVVATIKIGPRPGSGYSGPAVTDAGGDPFTCGTSVGGNPAVGNDTTAFSVNPSGAAPVGNENTTWSRVKAIYN